jgi:hypothetical protein
LFSIFINTGQAPFPVICTLFLRAEFIAVVFFLFGRSAFVVFQHGAEDDCSSIGFYAVMCGESPKGRGGAI